MLNAIQEQAAALLGRRGVSAVLGLRFGPEGALPCFFTAPEELSELAVEPKWPLAKTAWRAARDLPQGQSLGLVARGCDLRALAELEKAGQLRPGAVLAVALPCDAEQARACQCATPYPPGGYPVPGADFLADEAMAGLLQAPDRLAQWAGHFARCLKCYGCRNACPLCVCPSCKLEEDPYVSQGRVPPEPLTFHLIRAMHLADRCVGCGACQEACPSGLPLLALHLWLRRSLRERHGWESGGDGLSPLLTLARRGGPLGAPDPGWADTRQPDRTGGSHGR